MSAAEVMTSTDLCYVDPSLPLVDGKPVDCQPRVLAKPDGREIPLAPICLLKAIAKKAIVIDVRDPNEIEAKKGGVAISTAIHVPVNMDGKAQSERKTTLEEYKAKLEAAGVIPTDRPLIAHCTGGGRGSQATKFLKELGYEAYNGGGPTAVREAIEAMLAE